MYGLVFGKLCLNPQERIKSSFNSRNMNELDSKSTFSVMRKSGIWIKNPLLLAIAHLIMILKHTRNIIGLFFLSKDICHNLIFQQFEVE